MALTASITKKSVTQSLPGQFTVTVNLLLKSDEKEVLTQDFTLDYKTIENDNTKQIEQVKGIATEISKKLPELKREIQSVINRYKSEQAIFNNELFESMCKNLQNGLSL